MNNYEDLEKTYDKVQEEMSSAKIVDGALVQGSSNKDGVSLLVLGAKFSSLFPDSKTHNQTASPHMKYAK